MTSGATIVGGGLIVVFTPREGRLAHRIYLDGSPRVCLIESIEGTDQQVWPASPPMQALHVEDRPGGTQVALLVGMAGESHWSLACHGASHGGQIILDVACRIRRPSENLGSSYRLADGVALTDGDGWSLQHAAGICRVETSAHLTARGDSMHIGPQTPALPPPQTMQWKYGFRRMG